MSDLLRCPSALVVSGIEVLHRPAPSLVVVESLVETATGIVTDDTAPKGSGVDIAHFPAAGEQSEGQGRALSAYALSSILPHHEKLTDIDDVWIAREATAFIEDNEPGDTPINLYQIAVTVRLVEGKPRVEQAVVAAV